MHQLDYEALGRRRKIDRSTQSLSGLTSSTAAPTPLNHSNDAPLPSSLNIRSDKVLTGLPPEAAILLIPALVTPVIRSSFLDQTRKMATRA